MAGTAKNTSRAQGGYYKEQSCRCFKAKLRYARVSVSGCVRPSLRWVCFYHFANTSPITLTGCGVMGSHLRHPSVSGVFIRSSLSQSKPSPKKEPSDQRGFGEGIGVVHEVVKYNFLLIEHPISRGWPSHYLWVVPGTFWEGDCFPLSSNWAA